MPGRASAASSSWSPSPQRGGQHAAPRLLPRRAQEARSGSALVLVAIIPWARSTRRCYLRAAAPAWAGGGTRGVWGAQGRMGRAQWGSFALGKPPRSSSLPWPRGFTCGPGVHQAAEDGRGGSPTEKTTTGKTTSGKTTSGNTTTISRAGHSSWLLLLPWGATGIRQAQISLRAPDAGHRRQPRDGQERNSSRRSAAGARGCPRRAGADHPAGAHQWFPTPRGGHTPQAPGEATNGSEPPRQHPQVQGSARRGATGWGEPRGAGEQCRQRWVGVPVRGGLTCGRSLPRGSAGAR